MLKVECPHPLRHRSAGFFCAEARWWWTGKKTFTAFAGTSLAFAKRRSELLAVALDMLGADPHKLGEELGVHRMAIRRWRPKVLRTIDGRADSGLKSRAEADETFFRESRKGSREWRD